MLNVLFIYDIFNDTVTTCDCIASNCMVLSEQQNLKGYGGEWSWSNLRFCPGIYLEEVRKTT
jgi:hypothetical protein